MDDRIIPAIILNIYQPLAWLQSAKLWQLKSKQVIWAQEKWNTSTSENTMWYKQSYNAEKKVQFWSAAW